MKRELVCRVDEYTKNHGELIGFFDTPRGIVKFLNENSLEKTNTAWQHHYQVTKCYMDIPAGVSLSDTKRILEDDIWGASDIIETTLWVK